MIRSIQVNQDSFNNLATLPGIPGLEGALAEPGPFPSAEAFAARILTLPTHNRVANGDIAEIRQVINSH